MKRMGVYIQEIEIRILKTLCRTERSRGDGWIVEGNPDRRLQGRRRVRAGTRVRWIKSRGCPKKCNRGG